MDRYHQDLELRVDGERHAGIVTKEREVLLVHRVKNGYEYYVFPGGHRRVDEKGENTVIREVLEETGIEVRESKIAFEFKDYFNNKIDYYYLCKYKAGHQPYLNGEEKDADPKEDFFDPMWVDSANIKDLNILPGFAKDWLIKYLQK